MTELPRLQLIYFKLRALAEAPQMMMHYANVPYTYEMAWDFYGKPWAEAKPEVAFGQLPVLVVDSHTYIWQSGAITRYVATLTGTIPDDPLLVAQVDAVFDSTQELFPPLNPTVNVTAGDVHEQRKQTFLDSFPATLMNFAKQLERKDDGPFFFGAKPYYCDFSAYHHFSLAQILKADILNPHASVLHFMAAVESLPGVSEYLASRPELIDVGTEPKLVINGIAEPTGVKAGA